MRGRKNPRRDYLSSQSSTQERGVEKSFFLVSKRKSNDS